jgi:hypothetical protein
MNKDKHEVFFRLNAGQINGRIIAHPPRPRVLKRLREQEIAAGQQLDVLGFTETDWAADLDVDGAFRLGWLLCGGLDFGTTTLGRAIHGSGWVDPDLGCGPVNYLSADEVREAAAAFSQISDGDLERRLDSRKVDWESVSPGDLPSVLRAFPLVKNYYEDAAYRGHAMIVFHGW